MYSNQIERSVEERSMAESGSASKQSYDMAFKLKVVACAEGESNRGAARRFVVETGSKCGNQEMAEA